MPGWVAMTMLGGAATAFAAALAAAEAAGLEGATDAAAEGLTGAVVPPQLAKPSASIVVRTAAQDRMSAASTRTSELRQSA